MKKGDVESAAKIAKGTLGTSTGVGKNSDNELSLIDFGGDSEPNGSASTEPSPPAQQRQPGGLEDDLLGLSMGESYGQGGGISLGFGSNGNIPGPALISSTSDYSTARGPTPTTPPTPSHPQPVKPDYSAFSTFGSAAPTPKAATPQPSLFQQQQAGITAKAQPPTPSIDPFAALASPVRYSTPQQAQPSMFDFGNHQAPAVAPTAAPVADDDEWAFSSALPEALPPSNTIAVSNTNIGISLHATREAQTPAIITLSLTFSNATPQPISELTFMAAVTKGYSLKLQPQTGRRLQPHEQAGVRQVIYMNGVEQGKGDSVKLRWKAEYKVGEQPIKEQGEITSLGVA